MSLRADTMFESNQYLFWDDLHPTTAADALIADLAAAEASRFVTATPEPASLALLTVGFLAVLGWSRRFLLHD